MKKLFTLFLTLVTIFALAACKKKGETGRNLFKNGDFKDTNKETASSGDQFIGNWWLYGLDGGYGQMQVTEKGELEIAVMKESKKNYCIQLAYDGFKLYKDNKYTIEFDGYSTYDRHFEVRVQENGGYYTNYMLKDPENDDDIIVELGKKKKHYKFEFTSQVQDLAPRFVLNLGWFEGDEMVEKPDYIPDFDHGTIITIPKEFLYFDNFVMKCTYDAGNREDPLNRPMITLNQVGFLPNQKKEVVFRKASDKKLDTTFEIIDVATNSSVYNGTVEALKKKNENSNETVGYADFTSFKTPGTYKIVGNYSGESYQFTISNSVYDDVINDTLMMLYKQRCGEVLGENATDKFAHDACHQALATIYGTKTKIDVSGGWHDAGDYGKYVVAGAQTVADLLMTYEKYGDVYTYASYVTGTDSSIPDILEEAMWELDWMLKMQNSNGEVYHKVTTLEFPENRVSATEDTGELYVSPVSYAATADFAAVMAKAATLLNAKGIAADKATTYENAAKKAYSALSSMAKESFKNPDNIDYGQVKTGEYPDSELDDELAWASIELYTLTKDNKYLDSFKSSYSTKTDLGFGWANVQGFAVETYLSNVTTSDGKYNEIKKRFVNDALALVEQSKKDVYHTTVKSFEWGSNSTIANNGRFLDLAAKYATSEEQAKLYEVMVEQTNYLLGQNANCYCFVTGYGTLSPVNPHHRPSIIADQPMTGMLVGGPDSNFAENGNDAIATNNCEDSAPALCYIDHNNSWSTNEITIYWNSPFTYLLTATRDYCSK